MIPCAPCLEYPIENLTRGRLYPYDLLTIIRTFFLPPVKYPLVISGKTKFTLISMVHENFLQILTKYVRSNVQPFWFRKLFKQGEYGRVLDVGQDLPLVEVLARCRSSVTFALQIVITRLSVIIMEGTLECKVDSINRKSMGA